MAIGSILFRTKPVRYIKTKSDLNKGDNNNVLKAILISTREGGCCSVTGVGRAL